MEWIAGFKEAFAGRQMRCVSQSICFTNGRSHASATVQEAAPYFFSGCPLHCIFCQNHSISSESTGNCYDESSLAKLYLSLQKNGACNINLVSPTPYLPTVARSLEIAKGMGLSIPIVYNSSGYEKEESLKSLSGLIEIYLPDFKFLSEELAHTVCQAKDYPRFARKSLDEMIRQTGSIEYEGGKLKRGVILRHLVLPGQTRDSIEILNLIYNTYGTDSLILSLMRQYTPMHKGKEIPPFHRRITSLEYERVVRKARELGFKHIFVQEKESATEEFVPDFFETKPVFLDK